MANMNSYNQSSITHYVHVNTARGIKDPKSVKIGKGMSVSKNEHTKMTDKPGGSNVGKYKNVKGSDFVGPSGGAPKGSFPVNTKKRAKAALSYAHNAPNPTGIKKAVYRKFPSLKK